MAIRVLMYGLGPIGAAVARQVASRKGFQIVGAVDIDRNKVGLDLGEVIGLDRKLRVRITNDAAGAIKASKPDVAVLCTSSSLKNVMPQWSLGMIYRGMAQFMVIQVVCVVLLIVWPDIALWLPRALRG